ncbi:MAG: NADH-quinone oxidoreductase subunit NuoF [Deltaproteobacteria bacterium]|nr:MAG: NADH-quinone oxidoreductase subunit NuoF [Deltaproteobacteria bacterium]
MPIAETKIVSARFDDPEAKNIDAYEKSGGYRAARKAVRMDPAEIAEQVKASNLRGRGGAGFPTGIKWGFVPKDADTVYLVVNADESEPGTFKDRHILYWDPHLLIEGMICASRALRVRNAYIYMRGEMMREYKVVQAALDQAYAKGYLGKRIFGSDMDLDITIYRGAGAYICGEETALLSSLEGGRGWPRLKPPFPAVKGLFGKPTVVNNVETIANCGFIVEHGGKAFAEFGTERSGGTRLLSVCGHVEKPGVYEVTMQTTGREVIEEVCGGMRGGRKVKGVIPGGVSMPVLLPDELDVPFEFDALQRDERIREVEVHPGQKFDLGGGRTLRTMAGSGGVVVMDETTDMTKALWRILHFFHDESCGQCTPCREGTGWLVAVAKRIAFGDGRPGDVELLADIANGIAGNTICALGDAAAWPTLAFLTKYRDEFVAKIPRAARAVTGAAAALETSP